MERIDAIRARLAETSDTQYSMYDFGPCGCATGDAYFFGEARSDMRFLLDQLAEYERQRNLLAGVLAGNAYEQLRADIATIRDVWLEVGAPPPLSDAIAAAAAKVTKL